MALKGQAHRIAQRFGYDVVRFRGPFRKILLASTGVDTVIDVGANVGQYATYMRAIGWTGQIVSFEPLSDAYRELEAAAALDSLWETRRLALGPKTGRLEMQVASNRGMSSSLLPMAGEVHEAAGVGIVATELVAVERLDNVSLPGTSYYLKLDVQGYEPDVLAGAAETLGRTALVEAEVSLVELYQGQMLFQDVLVLLRELGFVLTDLEPEFRDGESEELLQMNAFFVRK